MTIDGLITTREVWRNAGTIYREFGAGALWRCFAAVLTRRRTTFLALAVRLRS
jgi:hypothetical protein